MSFAPRFSPNGKKIIFSLTIYMVNSNIFIQNLNSKRMYKITKNKYINICLFSY